MSQNINEPLLYYSLVAGCYFQRYEFQKSCYETFSNMKGSPQLGFEDRVKTLPLLTIDKEYSKGGNKYYSKLANKQIICKS